MPCGYDILKSKNELLSHNFLDEKLSSKKIILLMVISTLIDLVQVL